MTTLDRRLRLDLVIRTSKRKKEARSPQQQRDMAHACAQANGYEIVTIHDSGRDESGKTMNRATLNTVMERVERGETDGMIVALADRLGRAPIEEAMTYVRRLTGAGRLVLADMGGVPINLNDPAIETNCVVQLQMARQYWLTTANRFQRSQADAVKAGKHIGPTPLGYKREHGRLYPHDECAPIITEAYRVAARDGQHAAIDYLRRAVPGRRWDTDHVRRLLSNRAYLGESRSGAHVNLNAHEPLTTPTLWLAAQTTPQQRHTSGEYPLSGIATCECGAPMVGAHQSVGHRRYRRMRCSDENCPRGGSSINADKLEAYVRERLAAKVGRAHFRTLLDPHGKEEAEAAHAAAVYDYDQWLVGSTGIPAEAIARGLEIRQQAIDTALDRLRQIAEQCARSEDLPAAHELNDPTKFRRALLSGAVTVLRVRRGNGSRVVDEGRVVLKFIDDLDDDAGVLAA